MSTQSKTSRMNNLTRAFDFVRAPFLHRRAINILSLMLDPSSQLLSTRSDAEVGAYVESHPANRLIFRDLRLLHQLKLECFVVERDRDDHTRRRPCPYHKMVFDHFDGYFSSPRFALCSSEVREVESNRLDATAMHSKKSRCISIQC